MAQEPTTGTGLNITTATVHRAGAAATVVVAAERHPRLLRNAQN
jgi:hypothetical protein